MLLLEGLGFRQVLLSGANGDDLLLAAVLFGTTGAGRTVVSLLFIFHVHFLGSSRSRLMICILSRGTFLTSHIIVSVPSFSIIDSFLLILDLLMK